MEALAVVQTVSSIVQLVDFGSSCLQKGLQLYRGSSGILDENLAIEAAATHLSKLNDAVTASALTVADPTLKELCDQITSTANELLNALAKLKVVGTRTKWKCMRKAIKSVWGKEKLVAIESRLASFRSELNLHVCVSARDKLQGLDTQIITRFDSCDARTKEVLDAILNTRDVFSTALNDHSVLLQGFEKDLKQSLRINQATIQQDICNAASHAETVIHIEHSETRVAFCAEGDRIVQETAGSVRTAKTKIQATIESRADDSERMHQQTQNYIADLQSQLAQLTEQIMERDREFKATLESLKEATSKRERKVLYERTNAVAATLLALQIMYNHVKAMLEAFKINVIDWAQWSQAWSASRKVEVVLPIELQNVAQRNVDPYRLHGEYFAGRIRSEYPMLWHRRGLIDSDTLHQKWDIPQSKANFRDGRYNVSTKYCDIWLLAIVHASLVRNFQQDTAAFTLLQYPLINIRRIQENNWPIMRREQDLKQNLEYFTVFATLREMLSTPSSVSAKPAMIPSQPEECSKLDFEALSTSELNEMNSLVAWLVGPENKLPLEQGLTLRARGIAARIVTDLITLGLQIRVAEYTVVEDWDCLQNLEMIEIRCGLLGETS